MDEHINHLALLPKRPFTCRGGIFPWPTLVHGDDGKLFRPLVPIWMEVESGLIHTSGMLPAGKDPLQACLETLVGLVEKYLQNEACPTRLEVSDATLAAYLEEHLQGTGIEVERKKRLPKLNAVFKDMTRALGVDSTGPPGLLDAPGVSKEQVWAFAEAAKEFYAAAPWRFLSDTDLITVESPEPPRGMTCFVVLGAGRSTYGIGLYESIATYNCFLRQGIEGTFDGTMTSGLTQVTFDPIEELPAADAILWVEHKLPVAKEIAYPLVMKHLGKGKISRPDRDELLFLEAVLRALSNTTEDEIDSGRWEKEIRTSTGPRVVRLSIPDLLNPPSPKEWMDRGFSPDRRAHERVFADMNRFLAEHPLATGEGFARINRLFAGRSLDDPLTSPRSPADKSQDLCYQAFDCHGRRRVQMARQALVLNPDSADAHVILAEQAGTLEDEISHYLQGMQAAERTLGPEYLSENAGHFWSFPETRPYMRARLGLAQVLIESGKIAEGIAHYEDLLRLNPGDNQGVRYALLPLLLSTGRDVEAAKLLKEYNEESANWAYSRALLAYRLSGPSAVAERELRAAICVNPHVPELLLSDGPIPEPAHYAPGSFEEACVAAEELRPAFQATADAISWLSTASTRRIDEQEKLRRERRRKERAKAKKRKRR